MGNAKQMNRPYTLTCMKCGWAAVAKNRSWAKYESNLHRDGHRVWEDRDCVIAIKRENK